MQPLPPPDPEDAACTDEAVRRLLLRFEPLGATDAFGRVQRAAQIEPLGLLRFATIETGALIAALDADFAGVGTPEQTRLLDPPGNSDGYVLEDARFGIRFATGLAGERDAAERAYAGACRRLRFLADRLLEDVRAGDKLFVHALHRAADPDCVLLLYRALARHGPATLLAVQPDDGPALAWLAHGVMLGVLPPQPNFDAWVTLCRNALAMSQAAPAPTERGAPFTLWHGYHIEYAQLQRAAPARVGICAIMRDEASYVEEWVTFHRRQGVTQFRIYDNGSVDGTPEVLRRVGIEPVIWGGHSENFDGQQRAAYSEGARMLAGQVDWLAFIDVDEFMFCRDWSLAEALSVVLGTVGAIAVQQDVFGSAGQTARLPGPVTARFTRRAKLTHPECRWFKTIARPDLVAGFDSVHSVTLASGAYLMTDASPLTRDGPHPGEASRRAEGMIRMHHYPLKSLEEFRVKQAKWATRGHESRSRDDYFFTRDEYANAEECRDLAAG